MRLSALKLSGFKTFVEPTKLSLRSQLTGVVGPNGCGKSNLIDAIRWVLGESSVKNLRGEEASDVIFNGSKTRKPVGRASVELLFDNSDQTLIGAYAAYTDIAVRREVTRESGSQYFLNNRKCLKRDIVDLFLGTGLGNKNQYAIIEQGMVSRMVEAKPEDLRLLLEEAAGISKYRDRRRETENRMASTRDNLARLNDLLAEMTSRLEALAKQAANAEKYKAWKIEERQLAAQLWLLRVRLLQAQHQQLQTEKQQLEASQQAAQQAVLQKRLAWESSQQANKQASEALNAQQQQLSKAESQRDQARQGRDYQKQNHQQAQDALAKLQNQQIEAQSRQQQDQTQALQLRTQQASQALLIQDLSQQLTAASDYNQAAEQAVLQAEQHWQQAQSSVQTAALEAEKVRLNTLERQRQSQQVQRQRLAQEQSQLQPEDLRAQAEAARGVAERLQAELQALEAEFAQLDQHIHQAREQRQAIESQLHPQRSQLQQQQGALASLKTLQQAALRQDDSQAWLQQQGLAGLPKLIEVIHVQAGWESHVEQALGAALTAPVLPAGQPFPPQGPEVGLMLFQQDAENAVPVIYPDDSLASKVSGNQAVRAWLASQPLMMDGSQRGAGWVRYASRRQPTQGALGRVGQIQTLESQIATLKTDIQQAESHIQTLRQQQSQWEGLRQPKRLESLRQPLQAALMQQQSATLRAQQAESRLQQIMQEQQGLTDTSEAEILSQQQKVAELHALVQSQQSALLAAQSQLQQARQHGQASRSAWQQRQQALQRAEVQAAQVQATLSALEASLQQQDQQLLAVSEQIAQARHAVALAEAPCLLAEQALIEAEQQLAQQRDFMRDVRLQAESNDAAQANAWAAFRQAEEDERLQTLRMQQAALSQASSEGRLHSQQEGLEAALLEAEIAIDAVIGAEPEALEQQLGQVKRRLERLGAINLVAAQEASEQQERLQYLQAQHADVSAALASLETSMQQIDGETSALFDTTFDKVNGVFSARFPQLFGGGEAYLERIGHTGVKVVARPPGKRNASVHLLSGGEKAMTAVSLLLALFQLNPAPFCLLDEVDAPLDDANVMRFCDVVKEMSDNVQFLIITHNRLTMELAQQLHGVTMQEPGVSRLVSVDVQQAVASLQSSPASSSNEGT